MRKFTFSFKSLLVAAGLIVGSASAWAQDGTTWTFTDNATWGSVNMTAGKMYNNTAGEVATGGVTINFESGKASWIHSKTAQLWFDADGAATQPTANYIQLTVPAGYRVTVTGYGHSNTRYSYYTIDGTAGTTSGTQVKINDFQYTNETEDDVVFTFWPGNATKNGDGIMGVEAINLRDVSSVATHGYTATAKCGETVLDSWSGSEIEEGATYTVPAKAYIYANSKYYVLNDAKYPNTASGNFGYSTTMSTSDAAFDISYDEYAGDEIVYFTEAEALGGYTTTASNNNRSGGQNAYVQGSRQANLTTLGRGVYSVFFGKIDDRILALRRNGGDVYTNTIFEVSSGSSATTEFSIYENTDLFLTGYTTGQGKYNQSGSFDFVVIKKIADIPENVSTTIGSYKYATFSSTYALDFTDVDGLTAYIVTGVENSQIKMEPVTGTVAAGTGLVLYGEADTYNIPVVASGTTYNTESDPKNYLFAISSDYTLNAAGAGKNYVLTVQSGNVVFAPINETPASVTAGHSALWLPAGIALSKSLRIGGTATEVIAPEVADVEEEEVLYNMAGVQVDKNFKGFVVNQKGVKRFNK